MAPLKPLTCTMKRPPASASVIGMVTASVAAIPADRHAADEQARRAERRRAERDVLERVGRQHLVAGPRLRAVVGRRRRAEGAGPERGRPEGRRAGRRQLEPWIGPVHHQVVVGREVRQGHAQRRARRRRGDRERVDVAGVREVGGVERVGVDGFRERRVAQIVGVVAVVSRAQLTGHRRDESGTAIECGRRPQRGGVGAQHGAGFHLHGEPDVCHARRGRAGAGGGHRVAERRAGCDRIGEWCRRGGTDRELRRAGPGSIPGGQGELDLEARGPGAVDIEAGRVREKVGRPDDARGRGCRRASRPRRAAAMAGSSRRSSAAQADVERPHRGQRQGRPHRGGGFSWPAVWAAARVAAHPPAGQVTRLGTSDGARAPSGVCARFRVARRTGTSGAV